MVLSAIDKYWKLQFNFSECYSFTVTGVKWTNVLHTISTAAFLYLHLVITSMVALGKLIKEQTIGR